MTEKHFREVTLKLSSQDIASVRYLLSPDAERESDGYRLTRLIQILGKQI